MPRAAAGYDEATATNFKGTDKLPVGGYVLKILDVREEHYDWGDVVVLRFEIADGEYKGFFRRQYDAMSGEYKKWKGTYRLTIPTPRSGSEDDQNKYRRQLGFFKSQIKAFEDSNNGLHIDCSKDWDAAVLKGRMVGAVFGNQEYYKDGKSYWFTAADHLIPVQDVRSGDFRVPEDKEDKRKPKPQNDPFGQTAPAQSDIGISAEFDVSEFDLIDDGTLPF